MGEYFATKYVILYHFVAQVYIGLRAVKGLRTVSPRWNMEIKLIKVILIMFFSSWSSWCVLLFSPQRK